jgi:hypothetical protein
MTLKIDDNGTVREMTDDEVANLATMQAEAEINAEANQARVAAKQNALAKLEALGLTADDLKALGL